MLSDPSFDIRYLNNTTTQYRGAVAKRLMSMGFELVTEHIFMPVSAAARLLRRGNIRRVHITAAPGLAVDLSEFQRVDDDPQAVILGNLHQEFTWHRLNELFQMMQQGAQLVALHKNCYCRREHQITVHSSLRSNMLTASLLRSLAIQARHSSSSPLMILI